MLTRNWGSTIFLGQLIQTNLLFKLFYTSTNALKTFDSIEPYDFWLFPLYFNCKQYKYLLLILKYFNEM